MNNQLKVTKNTIFAFDLHGVVFKLCPIKVTMQLLKCPYKLKLLSIIFYPKLFFKTWQELRRGAIAEELLYKLAKDFPQFEKLLPTGFNVINSQKPIIGTVEIIKNLKRKGYKVHVLSNIGENSMKMMQEMFPDIFKHFDALMASNALDNYIKKPDSRAYEKYINIFNLNREDVIFIDDRQKNIKAALNVNIPSLLYKNSFQLNKTLTNLNTF
jgi:HAD superfamily hydrolase (TIGR01509 family)